MGNIVDREDFYYHSKPELNDRTRARLTEMQELGMKETGTASFGIEGVMSGMYIEKVWSYSDKDFNDYMDWVKEMINKNK